MEKNENFVKDLLNDLKNTSKYLSEAYIFDDHAEVPGEPGVGPEGYAEPQGVDPTIPQQQPQAAQQGDSAEEQAMHAQEVIKHEPIIGRIRDIVV